MTGRSLPEWIGVNADEAVPTRVRVRVFDRWLGRCAECGRRIAGGERWVCDHVRALILGGENRESNLQPLCEWCNAAKTAEDIGQKSKAASIRAKHIGAKPRSRW
jgi:5-methylcytosine-specific restriction endonuclease McrA